jgi:hypothetical protein
MNTDTILGKIELIERPIEPLGKPFNWFNSKIESFESLRRLSTRHSTKNYLSRIYPSSILLFGFTLILGCIGSVEIIRGDHPIFEKVPDGAVCNDGWRSQSQGPGTCSWHKGVDYYVYEDLQVDYHYANPEPYFMVGSALIVLIIFLYFFNKDFRLSISEVLVKALMGTYFVFYCCLAFPLILTRAGLQMIIILPMFLVMTINKFVLREK